MKRMMRSVTVRLRVAQFSAMMTAMREWLDANRYEPTMYKYDHNEDTVLGCLYCGTGCRGVCNAL